MADPVAGLREMGRVTRAAGVVAACVWDNAGGSGPLSPLWRAAQDLDPAISDEAGAAGAREGQLAQLARDAGLERVESSRLTVDVPFETFEEWWEPLTLGVGSGGAYVQGLPEPRRQALRERLQRVLGAGPFSMSASAWCVRARCSIRLRNAAVERTDRGMRDRPHPRVSRVDCREFLLSSEPPPLQSLPGLK